MDDKEFMEFKHDSVLLAEVLEQLVIKPNGIYVDGTLGGGGHAFEVCRRLEKGHLYGIDQDSIWIPKGNFLLLILIPN